MLPYGEEWRSKSKRISVGNVDRHPLYRLRLIIPYPPLARRVWVVKPNMNIQMEVFTGYYFLSNVLPFGQVKTPSPSSNEPADIPLSSVSSIVFPILSQVPEPELSSKFI